LSDSNVALNELDVIIFDFDGVFTDNTVYLSADGIEMLRFSKSDSLGLDLFREHLLNRQLNLELLILTKEKSPVVAHRAQKLKLNLIQDVSDKWGYIWQFVHFA
jgi:3-deoxy-D-manno-octulosonate 8-phosphate phosphatase KdsC-like HAD superfamily phosphatase